MLVLSTVHKPSNHSNDNKPRLVLLIVAVNSAEIRQIRKSSQKFGWAWFDWICQKWTDLPGLRCDTYLISGKLSVSEQFILQTYYCSASWPCWDLIPSSQLFLQHFTAVVIGLRWLRWWANFS